MPEIKIKNENHPQKKLILANSPKQRRMFFHFDCFHVWFVVEGWLNIPMDDHHLPQAAEL